MRLRLKVKALRLSPKARRRLAKGERGATAVVVAFSMILLMAAGAFGFDIAKLYFERQQLRNAIDASAQAAASALPDTNRAQTLAVQYANWNFPGLGLSTGDISFYCVVKNATGKASNGYPDATQVGAGRTCDAKPGWTNADAKCSDTSCAIPCNVGQSCNSISIEKTRVVPFVFGPAIDIPTGSTGRVKTLSCNGSCGGTPPPNPMNVVVMADRTPSMFNNQAAKSNNGNVDLNALKSGILSMSLQMNPEQQYIAFGAIQKSVPVRTSGNMATPPSSSDYTFQNTTKSCGWWSCNYSHTGNTFTGSWVPVAFSNNYVNVNSATKVASYNTSSNFYQSVNGLTYSNGTSNGRSFSSFTQADGMYGNTHLASALKGAARYLLGNDPNNIASIDAVTKRPDLYGTPKNVIIFETDGSPVEIFNNASDDTASVLNLNNSDDIGNRGGERACRNFQKVAANAKAAGITIITIGFGDASDPGNTCGGTTPTSQVLASVASPANGKDSLADNDCTKPEGVQAENTDLDNYYCAASGNDLKDVFAAAMGSMTGGTKFMTITDVGD